MKTPRITRTTSTSPWTRFTSLATKIDRTTPEGRNRVVDFLRAAAITIVVLGHWTIMAVHPTHGIEPHGVLMQAPWTHPLTWLFQIMPIFFLVGGYANALSWRSARRKKHTYGTWLRARLRRLGAPLIALLLTWLIGCAIALMAGAEPSMLQHLSQVALIPTWFLAAYIMVIMMAPPCLMLWEKYGWWSIAAGVVLAGIVDAISIAANQPLLAYPNYLLVWAAFHQFGYAWLDGRLRSWRNRLVMTAIGIAGLILLVGPGPYPVSMLTIAGDAISNSSPTRVTMAFLGMIQAGIVLSLEHVLSAALRNPVLWLVTVLINQRIMSWFLWHLTAVVCVASILLALGGFGLPVPLTGVWWATRPLWWSILLAATACFVLIFGRFETPRQDLRDAPPAWQPVLAGICVITGLAVLARAGIVGHSGLNWIWPLLPVLGLYAFGVFRLPRLLGRHPH